MNKVMSRSDALDLIGDGDVVAIPAVGESGWATYVIRGIRERFEERQSPRGLTVFAGCGQNTDSFALPGLLKCFVASHPHTAPKCIEMAGRGEIEGYTLPQGVLQQLYRSSAARQPGLLTKIGLGTYVDPRVEGVGVGPASTQEAVRVMEIDGEEWLFFKSYPINVGILRGTTADEKGNITIEHEALRLEMLEVALAAKARKGTVIVQVERVVAAGSLNPKDVIVPSTLVDAIVVAENPEDHRQVGGTVYNPFFSGGMKAPEAMGSESKSVLEAGDVICRRGVFELFKGAVINLGVGVGAGIGEVASAEGFTKNVTFTVELGVFGGKALGFPYFPAALNADAYVAHGSMFDFYHGGGLDITFLGAAQIDRDGNVNVSKFTDISEGQGGFIDISQTSAKVVFCTYFTAKGMKAAVSGGNISISQEGKIPKFVDAVSQITFSGKQAALRGQEVVYITERCVFVLENGTLTLTEIAPGMDLEKDILAHMGFKPNISGNLKTMDSRVFTPGRMGCFD
jgi:propionate CoA-transferase